MTENTYKIKKMSSLKSENLVCYKEGDRSLKKKIILKNPPYVKGKS